MIINFLTKEFLENVSIVSDILTGILSILLTGVIIYATKKYQNINMSNQVDNLICQAKINLDNMLYDFGKLKYEHSCVKKELDENQLLTVQVIEDYLTVMEMGCLRYCLKQIDKKSFKAMYLKDIKRIIEDVFLSKYLNCDYTYIRLVYHEWFGL